MNEAARKRSQRSAVLTLAQAVGAVRDRDTDAIALLRRQLAHSERMLAAVAADRDALLRDRERIAAALFMTDGSDIDTIIHRIEELHAAATAR